MKLGSGSAAVCPLVGIPAGTWLGYHGLVGGAPMQVHGFWSGRVIGVVLVSLALGLRQVANAAIG